MNFCVCISSRCACISACHFRVTNVEPPHPSLGEGTEDVHQPRKVVLQEVRPFKIERDQEMLTLKLPRIFQVHQVPRVSKGSGVRQARFASDGVLILPGRRSPIDRTGFGEGKVNRQTVCVTTGCWRLFRGKSCNVLSSYTVITPSWFAKEAGNSRSVEENWARVLETLYPTTLLSSSY